MSSRKWIVAALLALAIAVVPTAPVAAGGQVAQAPSWSRSQHSYINFLRAKVPVYRLLADQDLLEFGTTVCQYLRYGFTPESAYWINRDAGMDHRTAYWDVVAPAKYLCRDQWPRVRAWM